MGRDRDRRRENVEGMEREGGECGGDRESGRQIKTEVVKRAVGKERRKEKRRTWEMRHLSERRRTFKPSLQMAHVF